MSYFVLTNLAMTVNFPPQGHCWLNTCHSLNSIFMSHVFCYPLCSPLPQQVSLLFTDPLPHTYTHGPILYMCKKQAILFSNRFISHDPVISSSAHDPATVVILFWFINSLCISSIIFFFFFKFLLTHSYSLDRNVVLNAWGTSEK